MATSSNQRMHRSGRGLANASPKVRAAVARAGGLARAKQLREQRSRNTQEQE